MIRPCLVYLFPKYFPEEPSQDHVTTPIESIQSDEIRKDIKPLELETPVSTQIAQLENGAICIQPDPVSIEQQQNHILQTEYGIKNAGKQYVSSLAGYSHPESELLKTDGAGLDHSTYKKTDLEAAGEFAERRLEMAASGLKNMSPLVGSRGPDGITRLQSPVANNNIIIIDSNDLRRRGYAMSDAEKYMLEK